MTTNLNGLRVLLSDCISQEDMAAKLEQIEFEYTQLILRYNEECGPLEHKAEAIYYLRELRLALLNREI